MAVHRSLQLLVYLPAALAPGALLAFLLVSPVPVAAAQHSVSIVDDAFAPPEMTVNVGDTVTWINNGEGPHTVTSDTGAFDSGRLEPGASFSFTFTAAGTFGYRCQFHSGMAAQVTVQSAEQAPAAPAAPPAPAPPAPAPGAATPPPAHHGTGPAPAGDAATGTGAAPAADVPTTSLLPEPVSASTLLVLMGVGLFYTTLVVGIDRASKRV